MVTDKHNSQLPVHNMVNAAAEVGAFNKNYMFHEHDNGNSQGKTIPSTTHLPIRMELVAELVAILSKFLAQ